MAAYKKKFVVFIAAAALVGGALAPCFAQSQPAKDPQLSINTSAGLFSADPNNTILPAEDIGRGELFFKMIQAVLLVAVLGVGAIYFTKKFLPKITNSPGKKIHIAETVCLGPRKNLHLLKIGDRRLLIGSTSENVTMLADVTQALSEQQTDDNPGM